MYADDGLGYTNIAAPSSTMAARLFYQTLQQRATTTAPAPSPWPTATRPITFARPVTTALPVLKAPVTTVRPLTTVRPTVTPVLKVVPTAPLASGASMPLSAPVATETEGMASAVSPAKSPLPLILAGLAALFLLNRKGR